MLGMLKKNRLEKFDSPVKRNAWLHASTRQKLLGDISLKATEFLLHIHEKQMLMGEAI